MPAYTIHSISQLHSVLGFPKPKHPLISILYALLTTQADCDKVLVELDLFS